MNPRGLVPSLSYNGQIVTESAVVAQFLADAYPSHLLPTAGTPDAALQVRQKCDLTSEPLITDACLQRARINFFVDTYFSKVQTVSIKAIYPQSDAEAEEAAAEFVKQVEKELEPLLADAAPYFGGSKTLTLAEVR